MTSNKKIALIKQLIEDFWGYNTDEQVTNGAPVLIAAISTVIDFEEEK